jgi:hypothetical protein
MSNKTAPEPRTPREEKRENNTEEMRILYEMVLGEAFIKM